MNKYIIGIDGMRCGMCELHVEETISKAIWVKKIKASRHKKNVVVFTELSLNENDFKDIINPTGYRVTNFKQGTAFKTLFGWK